jgi:hypothetical protein
LIVELEPKIEDTVAVLMEDFAEVKYLKGISIKVVGSLKTGTRTNLGSKPTLDLQIGIEPPMEAFALREKVLQCLDLTTTSLCVRKRDELLGDTHPCIFAEFNKYLHDFKIRLIFGVECWEA